MVIAFAGPFSLPRLRRLLLAGAAVTIAAVALPMPHAGGAPIKYTVTSAADTNDGACTAAHCTLREALLKAKAHSGPDTIAFNLPPGQLTIAVTSLLPVVRGPVTVDGQTQPGFAGTPVVIVDGSLAGPVDGLRLTGSAAVVRGLAVRDFAGSGIALGGGGKHQLTRNRIQTAGAEGVRVDGGIGNVIGSTMSGLGNTVTGNVGTGVRIASGTGHAIRGNSISLNGGLGIDLGPATDPVPVDPNDPGDADTGPNGRQNAPAVDLAGSGPASAMFHGSISSIARTRYEIDLFSNTACDGSGRGEGGTRIGSTSTTTSAGGMGLFSLSSSEPLPAGTVVTATATDPSGNTSEFSECQGVLRSRSASGEAGISETSNTFGATVWDHDGDGDEDLFLNRHQMDPPRFYTNVGGTFTETHVGAYPVVDRHGCASADVNADDRPDLYCTLGAHLGTGFKKNELWIQQADGSFTDLSAEYGVTDPAGRGRYPAFLDVDDDGDPDLFVGNDYPRQDQFLSPNRLYLNQGGTSFGEAPGHGLTEEVGGWCVVPADLDADGWLDLVVCGKVVEHGLRVYRNVDGTIFEDVTATWGVACPDCRDAAVGDVDGDGWLDLVLARPTQLVLQRGSVGGFGPPAVIRTVTNGWRVELGDVDGDGWLDIYVLTTTNTGANPPDVVLVNLHGVRFAEIPIPQTSAGRGEDVVAIDRDGDGRPGFLVLNGGFDVAGPTRLIEFTPPDG